jgi:hypothetical protein
LDRENAPPPKALADSLASKPMPKWMTAGGIIIGLILGGRAYASFGQEGMNGRFLLNAFMCMICLYGSGLSRRLYLSDIGVVREMRGWGRTARRVLPWNGVRSVSLAFRADKMMVFFETGSMGWKVLFSKDQECAVRDILEQALPDIEINVIGRR